MSAFWKVLGFTLAGAMFAAGCVVTSDDDDDTDIGGFAGEGGETVVTGGTTSGGSGGTTGGSGGTTGGTGGTTGGSSGEAGSAGAAPIENPCEDPDNIISSDPMQCCQPCVETYCEAELTACGEETDCFAGNGSGEFELLQDCLAEKSASTDYDYEVALAECEADHAKDGVTFLGVTHGLIDCIKTNDCTVQCFYEATAAP